MRLFIPVRSVSVAFGATLLLVAEGGGAVDRISVDAGIGNHVAVFGISAGSADWKRWSFGDDWSLGLYGKGGLALWEGRDQDTQNKYVMDLSAYPVLRLETSTVSPFSPYLEASIGVNLLSRTRINDDREFSTAFQFGEFLGAGVTFGERHEYDFGLRVQHVSNGNIKFPNDGLTYGSLIFQYRFAAP